MDLVAQFLQGLSNPQTRRAYRRDLGQFFSKRPVEEKDVEATTAEALQDFFRKLEQEGLSVSTRRRRLSALRRFFDWLVERGSLNTNPVRSVNIQINAAQSDSDNRRVLTGEEVGRLVRRAKEASLSGPRDQALILTITFAALRRGEVVELDVEDVRPLGRHWIIDLAASAYKKIPDLVVDAIEAMKKTYEITSGPLWRSLSNRNRGERMSPDAIYKVVRRTAERADLDPVDIDTLRRTGLHLAVQGGARLPQIQAHGRLKHSASAATYFDASQQRGTLHESAVDCIDLDAEDLEVNSS